MKIEAKIVGFEQTTGNIIVEYYYDDVLYRTLGVTLPLVDGQYPSPEDIQKLALTYAPTYEYEREKALASNPDISGVMSLIQQ